ncbi:MAG: SH3 type 3 domain protein, partial [Parcubacteria group bacterium GW2011_GWA2_52_8]
VGTGQNFEEAHEAQVISPHLSSPTSGEELKEGVKFGFLAYSYSARNDGGNTADQQIATISDLNQLKIDIQQAKDRSEVIIVSMHAGIEYVRDPNQEQTDFAHAAIDAGADIVIGHHPHWIQTIEVYKEKPIFYSLGNFIFDQSWSVDTTEGLAVRFTFRGKELRQAELLPIIIENNCCPRPATETETQNILKKINATSSVISFE